MNLYGQKVKLIYTCNMVYVYSRGLQIAAHPRNYKKGAYITDKTIYALTIKIISTAAWNII